MTRKQILYLLEDDNNIAELITISMQMNDISVCAFPTCNSFLDKVVEMPPDIAVLDVMLPDGNGFDVLRTIRKKYDFPIIMLSALSKEVDKLKGFNFGADDYIAKPFGVLEFSARVKARLKINNINRKGQNIDDNLLVEGDICMDLSTMEVKHKGKQVELNNKEFLLLKYFVENVNMVFSREKLLAKVWGYDFCETRTVDNHVARLRKLGFDDKIITVFGVGYKFKS